MKRLLLLSVTGLFLLLLQCKQEPEPARLSFFPALSFSANPWGPWRVGYTLGDSLYPLQIALSTYADTADSIALWHATAQQAGYYPYIGQNRGSLSHANPTNGWAARPGQIVMEAANNGQYSVMQWVAPAAGKYSISAIFEGLHFNLSSTDVHVLLNATALFDDFIEGYGGDAAYHTVTGTKPATAYSDILDIQQGDVITFAVGYGANKNHYNDTTGLMVEIKPA